MVICICIVQNLTGIKVGTVIKTSEPLVLSLHSSADLSDGKRVARIWEGQKKSDGKIAVSYCHHSQKLSGVPGKNKLHRHHFPARQLS